MLINKGVCGSISPSYSASLGASVKRKSKEKRALLSLTHTRLFYHTESEDRKSKDYRADSFVSLYPFDLHLGIGKFQIGFYGSNNG